MCTSLSMTANKHDTYTVKSKSVGATLLCFQFAIGKHYTRAQAFYHNKLEKEDYAYM